MWTALPIPKLSGKQPSKSDKHGPFSSQDQSRRRDSRWYRGTHGPTNRTSCGSLNVGRRRTCALRSCDRLVALRANPRRVGAARKRSCTTDYRLHPPPRAQESVRPGAPRPPDRARASARDPAPESGSMLFRRDTPSISVPWHQRRPGFRRPSGKPSGRSVGGLVLTRIVLLAHWTSDVVAGLAVGVAIERALRSVTGFERR
jgi:hypothetical protein